MGDYYRNWPGYSPKPTPERPNPPDKPTPEEEALLVHYFVLREEISRLERIVGDDKELDKAVVLLKTGCKLVKRRLRRIGFVGPLRVRDQVSELG
jgi:hypothetical protein